MQYSNWTAFPVCLHESFFLGVVGELCAAIDAELVIDVVEMDLNRSLADKEFLADLHIAQARRHLFVQRNMPLTRCFVVASG